MNKRIIIYSTFAAILISIINSSYYLKGQPLDSLWMHNYGQNAISEYSFDIVQKNDSGYLVVGIIVTSNPQLYDAFIISIDKDGELLWEKNINSPGKDMFNEIIVSSDGNYIVGGSFNGSAWLIKINENGDTLWSKSYGYNFGEITSLQELENNDIIITGNRNESTYNFYLIRSNQFGDSLWAHKYSFDISISPWYDNSRCVRQTLDGGYMLLTGGIGGYGDFFSIIVKTDSNGETLWTMKEINGITSGTYLTDLLIEEDTVYIIGRVYPTSNEGSIVILKMKSDGEILWINYYNDQYSSQWSGYYGTFATNNTLYIAGSPYSDEQMIYVFEINKNGYLIWEKYYGEFGTEYNTRSITNCNNNSIAIAGYTYSNYPFSDIFVLKLWDKPSKISTQSKPYIDFNIYPNPSKSHINIELCIPNKALTQITIYNLYGEEIGILENRSLPKGKYSIQWNTATIPNGVYFCNIEYNDQLQVKKIIVSR